MALPNPTSEKLIVTLSGGSSAEAVAPGSPTRAAAFSPGDFAADLYDTYGHKVLTERSEQGRAVLDVRSLPAGLYNLRVGEGKSALSQHVQITH
ncbi:MAG: T9SS type A sorting domain-containing protein [Janthinobacterium lividum]